MRRKSMSKQNIIIIGLSLNLLILAGVIAFMFINASIANSKITNLTLELEEQNNFNIQIVATLNNEIEDLEETILILEEQLQINTKILDEYIGIVDTDLDIDQHSDLGVFNPVSVTNLNRIIYESSPNSPFVGRADAFIKASNITGLNPLYLLAHAALESGWGDSYLALTKHNYFGIGAYDSDPSRAYTMGDGLEAGIIEGAIWIKENWYDEGMVSLYDMIYTARHPYASAGDHWINSIVSIANRNI